jgi:hypothetical protein
LFSLRLPILLYYYTLPDQVEKEGKREKKGEERNVGRGNKSMEHTGEEKEVTCPHGTIQGIREQRERLVRAIINSPQPRMVMLSATPINNSKEEVDYCLSLLKRDG